MKIQELKKVIHQCLQEIMTDDPNAVSPDESPKVKQSQKKVEIGKQEVERERQKSIANDVKVTKSQKTFTTDPDAKKANVEHLKDLAKKKEISVAAMNAAKTSASNIK